MKTIGITGGIGSGKSYVSNLLRQKFGIPVYDCDKEAKRLTAEDKEIRQQLIALVGPEVFEGGILNKRLLTDYLFADVENASAVNAIIHPAVLKDFAEWSRAEGRGSFRDYNRPLVQEHPRRVNGPSATTIAPWCKSIQECSMVALESAILFESGFNAKVDYVLLVDAPEDVRLHRAMLRDNASDAQIRARMKMQHPELHRLQADYIIDNSMADDTRLLEQLTAALRRIVKSEG